MAFASSKDEPSSPVNRAHGTMEVRGDFVSNIFDRINAHLLTFAQRPENHQVLTLSYARRSRVALRKVPAGRIRKEAQNSERGYLGAGSQSERRRSPDHNARRATQMTSTSLCSKGNLLLRLSPTVSQSPLRFEQADCESTPSSPGRCSKHSSPSSLASSGCGRCS